jgi:hypothetical protein
VRALSHVFFFFFNPGPVWRVPIPNRYTAKAKLCFCKNNKRTIIRTMDRRTGICLPRGAHAAPGCPEAPSRRLHPGVLPPLPAHLGSSSSPGGDANSRKSTFPRRCWTGASRASICLPRGAHAAPGCPEAPSRRLHPGVLAPLPAHLGSSSSPGGVENSRKSTSPRRCWTGASRAGICLPRGAHAAPGCPEAPSRRLHPGVLSPMPAHLGSSSSPGGGCWKLEKIDLPPTMLDRRFKSRHLLAQRRACCPGLPRGPEQAPAPWSPRSDACAPRIIEFSGGCWNFKKIVLPPTMLDRRFKSRHLLAQRRACCPGLPRGPEQAPAPWSPRSAACAPRMIEFSGGCWKFEKIDLPPTMLDRRFKSRHLLAQRRACCPELPRGPEQAPAPWSPPSAACAPRIIGSPGGVGNSRKSTSPRRCWTGASRAGICLPRDAHAAPGCPEAPSRRLHPGVLPPLPAHLGSSSSPGGGVGNSRKSTSPRRCWTGASRAGICLPRGAHAAPGCPEAPSRHLHPGVLPPLPAHLGSSSSPGGGVGNSRKSTSPRRCWTGASRAGICLPRGAHAAPGCPEAPSRRLHPGVLPPMPAHLGSSSSPGGGVGNSRKSTSPRRCWTGASRAGICLPRDAHAAPGCPEAPSRRLHPGVLPPLPAHLG